MLDTLLAAAPALPPIHSSENKRSAQYPPAAQRSFQPSASADTSFVSSSTQTDHEYDYSEDAEAEADSLADDSQAFDGEGDLGSEAQDVDEVSVVIPLSDADGVLELDRDDIGNLALLSTQLRALSAPELATTFKVSRGDCNA